MSILVSSQPVREGGLLGVQLSGPTGEDGSTSTGTCRGDPGARSVCPHAIPGRTGRLGKEGRGGEG